MTTICVRELPCQPEAPARADVTIGSGRYGGYAAILKANMYGFSVDYPEVGTEGSHFKVLVATERNAAGQFRRNIPFLQVS